MSLSAERLKELLTYDPSTGEFRWRIKPCRRILAGALAGSINLDGYRVIRIDRQDYYAHRLVFLYIHGAMPKKQIDHKNLNTLDNRLQNLREATHAENKANTALRQNNHSGITGVSLSKNGKRYIARAGCTYIGTYDTREQAAKAYAAVAQRHYGEFAYQTQEQ